MSRELILEVPTAEEVVNARSKSLTTSLAITIHKFAEKKDKTFIVSNTLLGMNSDEDEVKQILLDKGYFVKRFYPECYSSEDIWFLEVALFEEDLSPEDLSPDDDLEIPPESGDDEELDFSDTDSDTDSDTAPDVGN